MATVGARGASGDTAKVTGSCSMAVWRAGWAERRGGGGRGRERERWWNHGGKGKVVAACHPSRPAWRTRPLSRDGAYECSGDVCVWMPRALRVRLWGCCGRAKERREKGGENGVVFFRNHFVLGEAEPVPPIVFFLFCAVQPPPPLPIFVPLRALPVRFNAAGLIALRGAVRSLTPALAARAFAREFGRAGRAAAEAKLRTLARALADRTFHNLQPYGHQSTQIKLYNCGANYSASSY